MTTPATREEVVELMARAYSGDPTGAFQPIARTERALTALEQHGLALVPVEATEAMIDGADKALNAWRQGLPADEKMLRRKFVHGAAFTEATVPEKHAIRYRAMLAASPYNKETGNG